GHDAEQVVVGAERPPPEPLGEIVRECARHGSYPSNGVRYLGIREIWSECPDCAEARIAAERHAEAERKAAYAQAAIEKMIGQAAIPARFIGRTFDNFHAVTTQQRETLWVVRDFVDNFEANSKSGNSLLFEGLPGTGKTHLALAALQTIMPAHLGLYTTCMGLIRAVRGTWRKDSECSEQHVLNTYAEVPLLVLDEIGAQNGTDNEQTLLFEVIDRRYRDMRPTIFLTNQNIPGLKDYIGPRAFDRLRETARVVSFTWASYRAAAREQSGNDSTFNQGGRA
ncbi:MAG: ATP-binding protein, partial [Comamonadaceae bacterium]